MKQLVVASTNAGKVREMSMALSDLADWTVETLPPELPEIEETGSTFIENATLKATHYSKLVQGLALADDSGLCVDALEGRPGIHSARYGPSAEARNQRLLDELGHLDTQSRSATFYCAFAVARAGAIVWTVQSELHGLITTSPAGEFGFGYDPIFFVPDLGKTLAQMTSEEKNRTSARGRALRKLRDFLQAG